MEKCNGSGSETQNKIPPPFVYLDLPVTGSIFRLTLSISPKVEKYSLMSVSLASCGRAPQNSLRSSSCTSAILFYYLKYKDPLVGVKAANLFQKQNAA